MNTLDVLAILSYFVVVIGAGIGFRRRAARDLESYFLGGKSIHWSLLSMSGAVSNFDITGTMWMVSVLWVLGMQSWWHHWMWGVALPAFSLAYLAGWVRRSGVMTAAEWMKTRFGDDAGGRLARYSYAVMAVVYCAAAVGYAFQGIGKFATEYVPLDALAARLPFGGEWVLANQATVLASAIFAVTTFYVVLGGLWSVVVTDVIQTVVLTVAGLIIAFLAWWRIDPQLLAERMPRGFLDFLPAWRLEPLAGTENAKYELFGFLVIAWVLKGLLMNAGGPGQQYDFQRYVAAASPRDAAKLAASWPFFLVVRWGMVMGIVLLAMTGVLSTDDPEKILPAILRDVLPAGLRGVVIAGLLAAFMSTFSSTLNAGASFVVRDLWQPIFAPRERDERRLIRLGYIATVALVGVGILVGRQATSIKEIWDWMMMALTAGVIVPNVLRWHWWRLNGMGFAAGCLGGMLLALVALFVPDAPIWVTFPVICLGSLLGSVGVSLATRPTDPAVLGEFWRTVRPFGFWGPVRRRETAPPTAAEAARTISAPRALANTALAVAGLTALYLFPMYFVAHANARAAACAAVAASAIVVLKFTWYDRLPREPEGDGAGEEADPGRA